MGQFNSVLALKSHLLLRKGHTNAVRGKDFIYFQDLSPEQQSIVTDHYVGIFENLKHELNQVDGAKTGLYILEKDYHMTSHVFSTQSRNDDINMCCTSVYTPIQNLLLFLQNTLECDNCHIKYEFKRDNFAKDKPLNYIFKDKRYECTGVLHIKLFPSTTS